MRRAGDDKVENKRNEQEVVEKDMKGKNRRGEGGRRERKEERRNHQSGTEEEEIRSTGILPRYHSASKSRTLSINITSYPSPEITFHMIQSKEKHESNKIVLPQKNIAIKTPKIWRDGRITVMGMTWLLKIWS
ncbi:predicted protein [Sclerotinia sclerotiorum 1980 UF-70]|uniref:Uncharacterized protein n=1 Tax=Sclerotinia sclerotiorum (strain ATCC 18683 / 1980 / Ss-1) TaxID=665079 RepID=A7EQ50_SCLS1|nr:predicted protein [Sclerotinia sclerotiorum 1980 UF-70]EDO04966.1 predicted protein [Sclerotinia sclerotiorum 1980 UF-70]